MKLNLNERNTSVNLALTGLMAALVLVATMFFKVEIPVGTDKTMIGFANVFFILPGRLLARFTAALQRESVPAFLT